MIGAEFGRDCRECPEVETEPYARDRLCWRCMAEGEHRGWIVGVGRPFSYVPAWCPRKEQTRKE